jgi:ParB-like chromosome segregation protein Spo0J
MTKLKITYKNTVDLIPYARNARTHSEAQVGQIAASIKEFGFTQPVLLDGQNGIIAGHGRVLAALKLELEQVPTIELQHLSDTQKQAYIIADNKLALNSTWDDQLLALEVEDLKAVDFDLSLIGFHSFELPDLESDKPETEDAPEDDELNFTIQYNIIFDHEEQQNDWYTFVKYLKEQYPDAETVAERIQLFLRANGYVTR